MRRARNALPLLFGLTLLGGVAWWFWPPAGTSGENAGASISSVPGARVDDDRIDPASDPLEGAARILDEAPAATTVADVGQPVADNLKPTAVDDQLRPDPFAAVVAATEPAPARTRAPVRKRRAAIPRNGDTGSDIDLLATLMQNIETSKSSDAAEAARLDDLVSRLRDQDAGAGASPRPRSQQIQSNLAECPAANTTAGIHCRQEICAVYAGRDPACPSAN